MSFYIWAFKNGMDVCVFVCVCVSDYLIFNGASTYHERCLIVKVWSQLESTGKQFFFDHTRDHAHILKIAYLKVCPTTPCEGSLERYGPGEQPPTLLKKISIDHTRGHARGHAHKFKNSIFTSLSYNIVWGSLERYGPGAQPPTLFTIF